MQKNYKYVIGAIIAVLVLAVGYLAIPKSSHTPTVAAGVPGTGEPTLYDNVNLTGSLIAGVNPNNGPVYPSNFVTGTVYAQGDFIQGGSCAISSVVSTTTLNLTAAQLACTQIDITNSSSSALTVNLPASSTVTSIANIGDESDTYIYAASTTAGNLTIVAGTGFSIASPIGVASTTAASSTVVAGTMSIFNINKLPTTNLLGLLIPTK